MNTERIFTLGVIADASHEALFMTRLTDKEFCKSETVHWELETFINKITMLYVDGKCVEFGFTNWVLQQLRKPMLVFVGHRPKVFGSRDGVTQAMTKRVLGRMACWVRLCKEVAAAEYPAFNVFSSFSVFRLPEDVRDEQRRLGEDIRGRLHRLVAFLKVPLEDLEQEYRYHFALAMAWKRAHPGVINKEAWRSVVEHVWKGAAPSSGALRACLVCWIGWSCSTSGVEHDIALLRRILTDHESTLAEERVADILTLTSDPITSAEEDIIVRDARVRWSTFYGLARESTGSARVDKGKKRGPAKKNSERAWLRRRRAAIAKEAAKWLRNGRKRGADARVLKASAEHWTPTMEKEISFQRDKKLKRLVQAEKEGHIVPTDITNPTEYGRKRKELEQAELANQAQRQKTQEQHKNAKASIRPTFPSLEGLNAFLDPNMSEDEKNKAKHHLDVGKAREANSRDEANLFVLASIAKVPQRIDWHAVLGGAQIMCLAFLRSGGRKGHTFAYQSACSITRRLWASPRFMERRQTLYNIIDHCMQKPTSKWSWMVGTIDEYKEAAGRVGASKKIFALVTPGDKSGDEVVCPSYICM